jgi:hypothetical protein
LSRVLGTASWLADGGESINLARTSDCRIILSGRPIRLEAPVGINEDALSGIVDFDDDDTELSDEDTDGREGDFDDSDEGDVSE